MNTILVSYIPTPNHGTALAITQTLLEKQLIACANIHNATSLYQWNGKTEKEQECIITAKTAPSLKSKLETTLKAIHPYSTPALIFWEATCNEEYFQWICTNVKNHQ